MGDWCNLAFVQTEDLQALEGAVRDVIKGAGRRLLDVSLSTGVNVSAEEMNQMHLFSKFHG